MSWFKNWFDSKYYHILYSDRNENEAIFLIDNLLKKFQPSKKSVILDLACGAGRHATYLNKQGFTVDGVDLSKKSLDKAKRTQSKTLHFFHQDIRDFKQKNKYDIILNLFTSFGYFENEKDNEKVMQNIVFSLKKKGLFIIDFFNANKIISELKTYEIKKIDNITFEINKRYDKNFVYKEIHITDKKNKHIFTEKVRLINREQFISYAQDANMTLLKTFGDYQLGEYTSNKSDRLLLVFQK